MGSRKRLYYLWSDGDGLLGHGKKQVSRPNLNANGVSLLTEVGLQYKLEPNINLSVGYQFIDDIGDNKTDKYDSHALMVGIDYFFGD
ncbi:hypothetical protein G5S52_23225 [Grimontia sp. S25]|uniref:Outer membrane protein OmpA-like transmembrane domain-containing protein n=1 Tax=Grimontia sedimenti TaxID=2711294 RepID=A0A6M1RJF7_9GAMM|nr:hypothetical protein [Grimontia sedimenti]